MDLRRLRNFVVAMPIAAISMLVAAGCTPPTSAPRTVTFDGPWRVKQQWWEGRSLVTYYQTPERAPEPAQGMVQWREAGGGETHSLAAPKWTRSLSEHEGTLVAFTKSYYLPTVTDLRNGRATRIINSDAREERVGHLLRSQAGGPWEEIGQAPDQPGVEIARVEALDGGRYFLDGNFVLKGQASHYAIGVMGPDRVLHIQKLITIDWFNQPQVAAGRNGEPWARSPYPFAFFFTPLRTQKHVLMLDQHTGWLQVFDGRTGEFVRWVRLFDEVDEARVKGFQSVVDKIVLDARPRADGTLLVSSRSREFAQVANGQSVTASLAEHQRKQWEDYPGIQWWSLDPATGKVTPEIAPKDIPGASEALSKGVFGFRPDGTVVDASDLVPF